MGDIFLCGIIFLEKFTLVTHRWYSSSRRWGEVAKILVVEDDAATNSLVGDYLTDAGHAILSACDGLKACL